MLAHNKSLLPTAQSAARSARSTLAAAEAYVNAIKLSVTEMTALMTSMGDLRVALSLSPLVPP